MLRTLSSSRLCPQATRLIRVNERTLIVPPQYGFDIRKFDSLTPVMSKDTFQRHFYDIHLPTYHKLNGLIENTHHQNETSVLTIMRNTIDSPGEKDIFTSAANIHNHERYFQNLAPQNREVFESMSEASKQKIKENFTSLDRLEYEFLCNTEALFGSGWVWLVDREGVLEVVSTHDHYSPEAVADNVTTIICLDVWEHAFWKENGIRKDRYLEKFWKNLSWDVVDARLQQAEENMKTAQRHYV